MTTHNKRPIAWHEENLRNTKDTLARERKILESQRLRVHELMDRVALMERQIIEAKRKGMEEFDRDRLLVQRKNRKNC